MQIRSAKIHTAASVRLPILFIVLFFCLEMGSLPILNWSRFDGTAIASPMPTSGTRARAAAREQSGIPKEAELVSATAQGVTIQLTIPESDYQINNNTTQTDARIPESQTISFPGCRFTTAPMLPRLPIQTALIAVPADVSFQLRVIEKRFTTHPVKKIAYTSAPHGRALPEVNRFSPDNLAVMRKVGWIRENRVLPIQFNPVQYNPARREVRLYHQIIVEVRFVGTVSRGLPASPSAIPNGLHTESDAYNAIFNDLLINPQNADQWRSSIGRAPLAPSVPVMSPHYKIGVSESGMHSITALELAAAGADIAAIMPRTLKLTNRGRQIPIFVRGEDDDRFDSTDEIVFYGERHHGENSYIDPSTDENIYWLSWNAGPGSRMVTKAVLPETSLTENHSFFLTRAHFEKDNTFRRFRDANLGENQRYEEFGDGLQTRSFSLSELPPLPNDSWFWSQLTAPASKPFNFHLSGLADTARPATVRVSLHGRSNTAHDCDIWLNDKISLGEAQWRGETEYQLQNPQLSQSFLENGSNVLRIINPGSQEALDIFLLNWIQVDYWRNFHAETDVLPFAITPTPDETGTVNPNFRVTLQNFSSRDVEIYGVDGTRYVGLSTLVDEKNPGTYRIIFRSTQVSPKEADDPAIQYIALARNKFRKPTISTDQPSDLRSTHNGADYIIITHANFIDEVQPLSDFREEQGMRTKVVDVQNIYDEFNHGILDPHAIRRFLEYTYYNWQPPAPTYVLLVGDTHIDIKNEPNFVPTIRVQIPGYGSSASDHQFVTFRGDDSFPDMLIGRMPANTRVDARIFVERTIRHETDSPVGPWHKRLLMLAGSDRTFHSQINRLVSRYQITSRYETERIYAPYQDTPDLSTPEGITTPIARRVIDGFNNGASLINYIGHGGGGIWSDSRMLDFEDPEQNLTNISQLPLVMSMTCYTAAFDGSKNSLAEELLRSANGGAIAVIGATSIGLLDGDYNLNIELLDVIFRGHTQNIGAIFAQAKTQFLINSPGFLDLAEVFSLLGDPATQLKIPNKPMEVEIDFGTPSTENGFGLDNAVTVSGTLPNRSFNGDAEIIVVPIAETDDPIPPERETISVTNGRFKTQIQLPTDTQFDIASIQAYAWNAEEEAIGHATYNILSRYVNNVRIVPFPVQPNQPVHLYTEVVDESNIEKLTLFWSLDAVEFFEIPVVPHNGNTYRSERPIPGYPEFELIDYYLEAQVAGGRTLQTETVTYDVGYVEPEVDLVLLEPTIAWDTEPPLLLSAQIRNVGSKPAQNVPVYFFQQTVETETEDGTSSISLRPTLSELQNATPIGGVQIIPEILPDSQVVASVPWQPSLGDYLITVYVDMPTAELPKGSFIEKREGNNRGYREFTANRILLSPETLDQPFQSQDGRFKVTIPPENLQGSAVLSYIEEPLTITNQPDILGAIPSSAFAYQLDLSEQTELTVTATFLKDEEGSGEPRIYRRDDIGNWVLIGNETVDEATVSAEVKLPGTFALLTHSDTSPPALALNIEHQGFVDGDYISDTPTISARIEDANGIDSRPEHIILTQNGQRVPEDEYVIAASPTSNNLILVTYSPVLEPGEYRIRLQAQDANGNTSDTTRTATVAGEFEIKNIANFPNPFVPGDGTHFAYYLTKAADEVSLKIYTITGRLILTVDTLDPSVSFNEFHFDGYDADGEPLANGVYLYKFTAKFTNAEGNTIRKQKVGKIAVRK